MTISSSNKTIPQNFCHCWKASIFPFQPFLHVVINELDGLSHGLRNEGAGVSTAQNVAAFAADAIEFLERSFDERNKHLKAMTSQGTRLDTIAYRSEESKRIVSSIMDLVIVMAISCAMVFNTYT